MGGEWPSGSSAAYEQRLLVLLLLQDDMVFLGQEGAGAGAGEDGNLDVFLPPTWLPSLRRQCWGGDPQQGARPAAAGSPPFDLCPCTSVRPSPGFRSVFSCQEH